MITESDSLYDRLEDRSVGELLKLINKEDQKIAFAVEKALPQIEKLVEAAALKMAEGGRLFYIGAGTSGRLGVLDASEIPPTFGAPPDWVVGLIAGGDYALRNPIEFAEDDPEQAWKDLALYKIGPEDVLIGIAASGTTPYVAGGLKKAGSEGITTGCIVCNAGSPVAANAAYPVEIITGPEFVTGSTRMKAGTATKLALNMISTSLMIRLGRVKGNKMVDMQLSNQKLIQRGVRMLTSDLGIDENAAAAMLRKFGSVRKVMEQFA